MSVRVSQFDVIAVQGPPDDALAVYSLAKNIVLAPPSDAVIVTGYEVAVVILPPSNVMIMQDLEVAVVIKPAPITSAAPILSMVMA